ncbi:MAG: hypothetical protein AABY26_02095 [Nanoarchaeota archaeon]
MAKKTKTKNNSNPPSFGKVPSAAEKQMPVQLIRPMSWRLDSYALAYTLAIMGAVWVLIVSVLGLGGYGMGMVETMQKHHFMYSLSASGILVGMAEAALCGLVLGFLFGWIYNKFA